jgi:tyrosine decarboxylase / aspartate 1-decarboxylase
MENIHKIQQLINQEFDEMKNIGTFTGVYCHPFVEKNVFRYLNKNLVDKKGYSSMMEFERSIDTFMKKLYKHYDGKTITTSGSTESLLLAFYYAREQAKYERKITKPNIILPEHAHYSLFKCAQMLEIEIKHASNGINHTIDTKSVEALIDRNTIMIVGVMGSTELGVVDDLRALDVIAAQHNVYLHIDAAIGGFIFPFINTPTPHTFQQLPSLYSMNISGHKFGLALPGCGLLLLRHNKTLDQYAGHVSYLSTGISRIESLMITSSPIGVFSLAVNIKHFGLRGYRENAKEYIRAKENIKKRLEAMDISVFNGSLYTPQLFFYAEHLEELSNYLKNKGWMQNTYLAKGLEQEGIRIVIKYGQELLLENDLMNDIEDFYMTKTSSQHSAANESYEQPFQNVEEEF